MLRLDLLDKKRGQLSLSDIDPALEKCEILGVDQQFNRTWTSDRHVGYWHLGQHPPPRSVEGLWKFENLLERRLAKVHVPLLVQSQVPLQILRTLRIGSGCGIHLACADKLAKSWCVADSKFLRACPSSAIAIK